MAGHACWVQRAGLSAPTPWPSRVLLLPALLPGRAPADSPQPVEGRTALRGLLVGQAWIQRLPWLLEAV